MRFLSTTGRTGPNPIETWLAGTFDTNTRGEFVNDLWAFMGNGKYNWPLNQYIATSAMSQSPACPYPRRAVIFALMAPEGPKSLRDAVSRAIHDLEYIEEGKN
ncbi:hypothetical protein EYZ11_006879 [Aspergillus tanneri]|uniref:Uncharacterized protein n=1 Tax=Aspergillus tanneri TaxID=1220188 RepID=A0A4S3JEB8_9EURO|nr:uncharacterized protein ATNIH1004_008753 [Aspergillus tanneri]KAA8644548.1 hypothetical protein ATNIH1004_008753 [Aspergillus tanneri]THC93629.1 hypothetical protein EYZ11_006879 [Aspergillus tanneri]